MTDMWYYEKECIDNGLRLICGVDEAGRGPLAGPVYAAAVILPPLTSIPELGDSKKLSEKTRDKLFYDIKKLAVDYSIGMATHEEIDEHNILKATFIAMNRAIDTLKNKPCIALIDGNREPSAKCRTSCIVKGDAKSASIAAASILAKVSRDRHMLEMAEKYPQYAFEKHKGYGTKLHYERLNEHGPSDIHRVTFLKKWKTGSINQETFGGTYSPDEHPAKPVSKVLGDLGESLALKYLSEKGYATVETGFRSFFGEIDLIVKDLSYIVFAEVKLRKSKNFAQAREQVTKSKQEKIKATASMWLSSHKTKLQPRFDVIEIYAPDAQAPEIIHIENAFE